MFLKINGNENHWINTDAITLIRFQESGGCYYLEMGDKLTIIPSRDSEMHAWIASWHNLDSQLLSEALNV